jgi:hypothetical protein
MKRLRMIAGLTIGLLLLASIVAMFLQVPPAEVARSHCAQRGFQAENLVLSGYRGTGNLFGKEETVEFQIKGANPPRKVVVELRQPVYFLPWQVEAVREEAQP